MLFFLGSEYFLPGIVNFLSFIYFVENMNTILSHLNQSFVGRRGRCCIGVDLIISIWLLADSLKREAIFVDCRLFQDPYLSGWFSSSWSRVDVTAVTAELQRCPSDRH